MLYCELTLTEQSTLQVALAQQMSFRAIAKLLKRAPSIISHEVRRHAGARRIIRRIRHSITVTPSIMPA